MRRKLASETQDNDSVGSGKRVRSDIIEDVESLQDSSLIPHSSSGTLLVDSTTSAEEKQAIEKPVEPQDDGGKQVVKYSRKTVALFLCYNGFGYFGMQYNAGFKTIEGDLLTALSKAGAIEEQAKYQLAKLHFQRASKTDKGVSAVRQIVSLKMDILRDYLEALNAILPPQIRVLRILRTTQSFNCKHFCSSRFYQYLCPTYAFSPTYEQTYEGYRIDKNTIEQLGEILSIFKGTHNFHNYTSAVKATDPSCNRYILDISTGEPFTDSNTNLEFISINLHGQSFMLHQIRKMIGITIAVMKKYAGREIIKRSFSLHTIETPKAPSLGLLLDRQMFKGYNKKFGDDGIHQPISWESVEKEVIEFRDKYIYPHIMQQEIEEKSMFHWLGHLKKHNFSSDTSEGGKDLDGIPEEPIVGIISETSKVEAVEEATKEYREGIKLEITGETTTETKEESKQVTIEESIAGYKGVCTTETSDEVATESKTDILATVVQGEH